MGLSLSLGLGLGLGLNLGSGDCYAAGWANVDHAGSPHRCDERVDLTGPLPWSAGTLPRVYAGHVLEHLEFAEVVRLLARLRPLLVPGGELMVVGPDVDRGAAMLAAGEIDRATFDVLLHGEGRWPGDRHLWRCTAGRVVEALRGSGYFYVQELPSVGVVPAIWPVVNRRLEWQCAVSAVAY